MPMASILCLPTHHGGLKNKLDDYLCRTPITPSSHLGRLSSSSLSTDARKFACRSRRRQLGLCRKVHFRGLLSKCKATEFDSRPQETGEEDVAMGTLIWRAIKLPIYSVALVPLMVGSAAAYFQSGNFSTRLFVVILASSVLIISWLNLSNDAYDFSTGADKNKKESVVKLVGSPTGTLVAAYTFLALGFLGLTWASLEAGNLRSILFLAFSIVCGYIYQCPPFRLSYQGLGEPLCFAAFGPFATTAFYLLQSNAREMRYLPISNTILSASILVGMTTTLILFCSHFHQVEGDGAVGKMSPLVRLGTERGSKVVKVAVIMLYVLLFALGLSKSLPFTCIFFCGLTIPVGKLVVSFVEENHKDKQKIFMAKYFCVRLHAIFGVALAAGLVVARLISITSF
ncbi:2-carboxy-1,4-naphthoquinone phytyltransferase, chloroplastic isoform X1 [Benincasa hispida]|uniref:2-carboxy-1,4-naphthoquinone phytyltransferase, chloroplastic isoform X1 n=1 Tax=Benincasa hispida TaxID=102211 RepID=UPI00190174C9|nr:2-carboxy-1,4-naphthoquinone phytyltransferase, chloroplastic isoform X1 [Benincasa hispida]